MHIRISLENLNNTLYNSANFIDTDYEKYEIISMKN